MKAVLGRISIAIAAFIGVALCGLITWGIIWLIQVESFPTPVIPTPKMPANNAFNTFQAAAKLLVNPDDISAASAGGSGYTLARKQALVAANSAALAKLDQGFTENYRNPPVRSLEQKLSYYRDFRNMARLLKVKAEVDQARGHWQDSAEASLDAIQLGAAIPHGSELIGGLVGIACEAEGRRPLWHSISNLNSAQARADLTRLQKIQASEVRLCDVWQEEEWYGQACLLEIGHMNHMGDNTVGQLILKTGLKNYTQYMNQTVRIAQKPYALKTPLPPVPHDLLSSLALPVFSRSSAKYTDNETQNDLVLVSLALQAYKLDHGTYPTSLDQLAPAYLKAVPDDPFALKASLRYRRAGTSYVLYSIGPDGKDDGGKAILNTPSHYSERYKKVIEEKANYSVYPDSKGDIVAGVNF